MRKVLALGAMAFMLMAASPQPGTVKVHEGEPGKRNDPHVDCAFHFHDFTDSTADTWVVRSWPPTGDGSVVAQGAGEGDLTLPPGHYKVTWGRNKHKVFWVEACPGESPSPSPSASPSSSPRVTPSPRIIATSDATPAATLPPTSMVSDRTPVSPAWYGALFALIFAGSLGMLLRRR